MHKIMLDQNLTNSAKFNAPQPNSLNIPEKPKFRQLK